jgi:hypothetical protein
MSNFKLAIDSRSYNKLMFDDYKLLLEECCKIADSLPTSSLNDPFCSDKYGYLFKNIGSMQQIVQPLQDQDEKVHTLRDAWINIVVSQKRNYNQYISDILEQYSPQQNNQ